VSDSDYDADDHDNLKLNTTYGVEAAGTVKEAIEKDGTLIISVTCEFVVHHAAREPVTDTTLAGLIMSQGVCEANVAECHIIEANND
jgi:hypothetical protein